MKQKSGEAINAAYCVQKSKSKVMQYSLLRLRLSIFIKAAFQNHA